MLEIIGHVSNVAGALGGIVAAIGVIRLLAAKRRQEQLVEVSLVLTSTSQKFVLPLQLQRKDITRAELLGRLGMFVKGGQRFSLAALGSAQFLGNLNEVARGNKNELVLQVSEEEISQFKL